jgi:sporulation protein YlmC with PRC-barrel domain
MLRKVVTATALGALLATGAIAQQSPTTPPASTTPPQASTTPSTSKAAGSQAVISEQKPDQFLASKFEGTDVIGTDNQKIGDVSDILFDKEGKIHALVIGVGGFLGLGAKDVALSMDSFEVVPASSTSAGGNTSATTGSSADGTNIKLKLSMTKDELKNAPDFKAYQAPAPARPAPTTGAGGGAGTRPGGTTK